MFRTKLDENDIIARNKGRSLAKGYSPAEGIDYEETYTHVAHLDAIRLLLAFLNEFIKKQVYVFQPSDFEDQENPNFVFKLKRALNGLKQAHRA